MTERERKYVPYDHGRHWEAHDAYFAGGGVEPFLTGVIPSLSTNNHALALQTAQLLLAHLGDAAGDDPVHVLEVGAGLGRFARNLLRALDLELGEPGRKLAARLRYIYSDYSDAMVREASEGPDLAPLVEQGRVIPIRYDLRAPAELPPGVRIAAVLCNYVCCVLPAKYLRKSAAGWTELLIDAAAPPAAAAGDDGDAYAWGPVDLTAVRHGALAGELLADLDEGWITLPHGFLDFLSGVAPLLAEDAIFVLNDYGTSILRQLRGRPEVRPRLYGETQNIQVTFNLLDLYARDAGLALVRTLNPLLSVHTAVLGRAPFRPAVAAVFDDVYIQHHGPQQFLDQVAAARLFLERKDYPRAIRFFARAVRLDPLNPELHLRLGAACTACGLEEQAVEILRTGMELDGWKQHDFDLALGEAYARHDVGIAVDWFRRSLAREEKVPTLLNLATLLAARGDFVEAYRCHRRAAELAPDDADVAACLEQLKTRFWRTLDPG